MPARRPRTEAQKAARREAYKKAREAGLTRHQARFFHTPKGVERSLHGAAAFPKPVEKEFGRFPTFKEMRYPYHYVCLIHMGANASETHTRFMTIVSEMPLTYGEIWNRIVRKVRADSHNHYEGEFVWQFTVTEAQRWTGGNARLATEAMA